MALIINGNTPTNVMIKAGEEIKQVNSVIFAQSPNLIPFPYAFQEAYGNTFTISGVTFTVNEDGSIAINGTNETSSAISLVIVSASKKLQVTPGNYLMYGIIGGSYTTYGLNCTLYKGETTTDYYYRYKNIYNDNRPIGTDSAPLLANVTDNTVGLAVNLVVRRNTTVNTIVKPMFVKGNMVYYNAPATLSEEIL